MAFAVAQGISDCCFCTCQAAYFSSTYRELTLKVSIKLECDLHIEEAVHSGAKRVPAEKSIFNLKFVFYL